jgi:hypothetical protein
VELAARDRAFVAGDSDALAVRTEAGAFRLTVEAARSNLVGLMLDSTRRRLLLVAPRYRVKVVLHPSDAAPATAASSLPDTFPQGGKRSWSGEIAARSLDALARLAVVAYPA